MAVNSFKPVRSCSIEHNTTILFNYENHTMVRFVGELCARHRASLTRPLPAVCALTPLCGGVEAGLAIDHLHPAPSPPVSRVASIQDITSNSGTSDHMDFSLYATIRSKNNASHYDREKREDIARLDTDKHGRDITPAEKYLLARMSLHPTLLESRKKHGDTEEYTYVLHSSACVD